MSGVVFWVVRHAEREDNINSNWSRNSTLRSDNSPLSRRGQGFVSFLCIFIYFACGSNVAGRIFSDNVG